MFRAGLVLLACCTVLGGPTAVRAQENSAGKQTYDRWCAGCHGADGDGRGFAATYMLPRPRDFTDALYQIRSTASGELPTDDDILRVIDDGMPGTAMPGWKETLSGDERVDLVTHLKSFSRFFGRGDVPEPLDLGGAPSVTEDGIAEGRRLFEEVECWKCHGQVGRGDGPSAPTLEDDWEQPVRAADLTMNWMFNGGGRTEDIAHRLMTGLNGTPMPSFYDLIDADVITREQLWRIAQFVRSLSPEEPPAVREVIRAGLVDGALPAAVDDPAWDSAEAGWVPMVGQIIVKPRWFAPTVAGVSVRALHNGDEIALLLEWDDPSPSPHEDWEEWRQKVIAAMMSDDAREDLTDAGAGLPDAIAVQFPPTIPAGMGRPYFLMGDERAPVYLMRWRSSPETFDEAAASGMHDIRPLGGNAVSGTAEFEHGRWRVVLRRAIGNGDVVERIAFETGRPIPMAVFAWDGSNNESETRGAISTWYFLVLDEPASSKVVVVPLIAVLLTAALGVIVVTRAQRSKREDDDEYEHSIDTQRGESHVE